MVPRQRARRIALPVVDCGEIIVIPRLRCRFPCRGPRPGALPRSRIERERTGVLLRGLFGMRIRPAAGWRLWLGSLAAWLCASPSGGLEVPFCGIYATTLSADVRCCSGPPRLHLG